MTRSEVRTTLLEVIKPYLKVDDLATVTDESRFIEDLGANSARLVDIVLETEDRFQISIDDREADGLLTIGGALDVVMAKRAFPAAV